MDELTVRGFVKDQTAKTIVLSESAEEEALVLLGRYGFDNVSGSPLTLREIRSAMACLPERVREELIRDLVNKELSLAEAADEPF
ncbi:MAG TPA: hypothetical protein VNT75_19620 [Symbiobacteriaceae bacterium]|nr:hypothetical protein [Symbiobacteriaceae bacterium]